MTPEWFLESGWGTTAACLAGAIALLAALRSALGRAELALREKLLIVVAAGGLATLGVTLPFLTAADAERAAELARSRPDLLLGAVVVVALVVLALAILAWIRFLFRTAMRMALAAALPGIAGGWAVARFVLAAYFDGWAGTHLGEAGWRTLLDVAGVAFIVLLASRTLRGAPARG